MCNTSDGTEERGMVKTRLGSDVVVSTNRQMCDGEVGGKGVVAQSQIKPNGGGRAGLRKALVIRT